MPFDPRRWDKLLVPGDVENQRHIIERNLDQPALALYDDILSLENVADPFTRRLPAESFGVTGDISGFRDIVIAHFRTHLAEEIADAIYSHAEASSRDVQAHQPEHNSRYGAFSDRVTNFKETARALQASAFRQFEQIVASLGVVISGVRENLLWANEWTINHILLNFIMWIPRVSEGTSNLSRDWLAPIWLRPFIEIAGKRHTLLVDIRQKALTAEGTRLLFARMTHAVKKELDEHSEKMIDEYLSRCVPSSNLDAPTTAIRIASGSTSHLQPAIQDTAATRAPSQARSLPIRSSSAPLSKFEATVGELMVQARRDCPSKYLPQTEISRIAVLLDAKKIPVRSNLERAAARTTAEYNQRHPKGAIKSWKAASSHPQFRRAVRKRFSRAEEKYKKATPPIAEPSAGPSRTTI